ncbi:MAG: VOC family protein [Anaerolineae bacterium]|nr:VOC family protein [Anaerolineae bacterium]
MNEETAPQNQTPLSIDPATRIGGVTLGVADLGQMVSFYEKLIGLKILKRTATAATLGIDNVPLVSLELRPNGQRYPRATGLFHMALLLPSREDLGQWLKHLVTHNYRLDGAGEHLVSEALYLSDPEGNGIEMYRDRPRETWEYEADGRVKMATLAVDLRALIADGSDAPFTGLPGGTTMGHIHLQVNDVNKAVQFYRDDLGMDLMALMPSAGFLSAGGYHHHIGANTWNSRGSTPPPAGSLGLIKYNLILPSAEAHDQVITRLENLDYPLEESETGSLIQDPAGNRVGLIIDR